MRPETKEEETTWETYDGEDVSEAFALNGTQLLYQGKAILRRDSRSLHRKNKHSGRPFFRRKQSFTGC